MANPLYQMLMGGNIGPMQNTQSPMMQPYANPIQNANAIYQAMRNPAQFVRQAIPDLPPDIANDPNRILQYLQQTRGITNEQIQMAASMIPPF